MTLNSALPLVDVLLNSVWTVPFETQSVCPHHGLHHVCLVVPQRFHSMENIHNVLLLDHLIDAADGTERSRTSSTGTAEEECRAGRVGREKKERERNLFQHFATENHHVQKELNGEEDF